MGKSDRYSKGQGGAQNKSVRIGVMFSIDPNAPTVSDALVNIAKRSKSSNA